MPPSDQTRRAVTLGIGASALSGPAFASEDTYTEAEIIAAGERAFGATAEGLAATVRHVFADLGQPNGYIEGREGSGAAGAGLRYGDGQLVLKRFGDSRRQVYWRGPSIGWDVGGNASKVFTLIYNMSDPDQIYMRFPGVEGSAYFVGGVGVNYQRKNGITLAPMRAGVGLRLGASIGYLVYTRRRNFFPF